MLNIDNFIFKLNKTTDTKKYYRCIDSNCTVTLHTDLHDIVLKINGEHCHPPEPEDVQIRTFKQVVKSRAIAEATPIPQLYDEEAARIGLSTLSIAALPSQRELSSTLNKARRLQTPNIPDTQLFDIPESYTKTLNGQSFLCIDQIIKRKTRMLVFASDEQLKLLFNSSVILMDGTFSSSPSMFDQVYCLHAIKFEQSFVCVIALLPDRKSSTYKYFFRELRSKADQLHMTFSPNTIMSDFEGALADAVRGEFSSSHHVGCFFHYTQAIYRNIQTLGLSNEYAVDENIRSTCRKLMALALMPVSLVIEAFDDLYDSIVQLPTAKFDLLKALFTYFENQWIKKVDVQRWNVYGLKLRTNNNAEGYHNRLNSRISKHHPNIWAFIGCIQREEKRFCHLLIQMKGGLEVRSKSNKTLVIQQRIDTLYARHNNGDLTRNELLEGLSYVVAKNIKSKNKK